MEKIPSRRGFLSGLLATSAIGAVGTTILNRKSENEENFDEIGQLANKYQLENVPSEKKQKQEGDFLEFLNIEKNLKNIKWKAFLGLSSVAF